MSRPPARPQARWFAMHVRTPELRSAKHARRDPVPPDPHAHLGQAPRTTPLIGALLGSPVDARVHPATFEVHPDKRTRAAPRRTRCFLLGVVDIERHTAPSERTVPQRTIGSPPRCLDPAPRLPGYLPRAARTNAATRAASFRPGAASTPLATSTPSNPPSFATAETFSGVKPPAHHTRGGRTATRRATSASNG